MFIGFNRALSAGVNNMSLDLYGEYVRQQTNTNRTHQFKHGYPHFDLDSTTSLLKKQYKHTIYRDEERNGIRCVVLHWQPV